MGKDPCNLSYRTALARALIDGGRAAEALAIAEPPAGTSAVEIELWRAGRKPIHAGDRATEAEAWRAVCKARSQDVMAWTNLGRSLLSQYRFTEAEVPIERRWTWPRF